MVLNTALYELNAKPRKEFSRVQKKWKPDGARSCRCGVCGNTSHPNSNNFWQVIELVHGFALLWWSTTPVRLTSSGWWIHSSCPIANNKHFNRLVPWKEVEKHTTFKIPPHREHYLPLMNVCFWYHLRKIMSGPRLFYTPRCCKSFTFLHHLSIPLKKWRKWKVWSSLQNSTKSIFFLFRQTRTVKMCHDFSSNPIFGHFIWNVRG